VLNGFDESPLPGVLGIGFNQLPPLVDRLVPDHFGCHLAPQVIQVSASESVLVKGVCQLVDPFMELLAGS
jgi:hypothetical protein